jgi:hypothetical protein
MSKKRIKKTHRRGKIGLNDLSATLKSFKLLHPARKKTTAGISSNKNDFLTLSLQIAPGGQSLQGRLFYFLKKSLGFISYV